MDSTIEMEPVRAGEEREGAPQRSRPPIEVGWLVVGRIDPVDREAVRAARERTAAVLRETFPGFDWQMPLVERRDLGQDIREEPVALLDFGIHERDAMHWDFCLVVTGADLVSHYKPYALAVPSRSVSVGVISTARIDPKAEGREMPEEDRALLMAQRIHALALHLFGHLNGLEHGGELPQAMFDLREVADLDRMDGYDAEDVERLREELEDVADVRLEEVRGAASRPLAFYPRAVWMNLDDIWSAVRLAQPWMFPVRLSRLTTAAASALVILLITAEAWDLGMNQRPGFVVALSVLTLLATTAYVLKRQRLLVRRGRGRLTEQTVVTNVSIALTVMLGLGVTYAALYGLTLLLARVLFPDPLVATWAASLDGGVGARHYLVLAGFVAALGILIGSLGASFEEESYFRHIAYVDEET